MNTQAERVIEYRNKVEVVPGANTSINAASNANNPSDELIFLALANFLPSSTTAFAEKKPKNSALASPR